MNQGLNLVCGLSPRLVLQYLLEKGLHLQRALA